MFHGLVEVRWERRLPRLYLHEKYEPYVKWSLRGLLLLGVVGAFISLPGAIGTIVSLALIVFEQFLERVVFMYSSMFVQPLPTFDLQADRWKGMLFAIPTDQRAGTPAIMGMVFDDAMYAHQHFDLLRAWNEDQTSGTRGHLKVTIIIDEEWYYIYLYPSLERPIVGAFFDEVEKTSRVDKPGKEHMKLVTQLMICRSFSTMQGFALGHFLDYMKTGCPFLLAPYVGDGTSAREVAGSPPIEIRELKVRAGHEVTRNDVEYGHWRMVQRGAFD